MDKIWNQFVFIFKMEWWTNIIKHVVSSEIYKHGYAILFLKTVQIDCVWPFYESGGGI